MFDDDQYVIANARVQRGLDWDTVRWAFTTTETANWHPLTWLSYLLDVELFGVNAGKHHLVSLLLHALNAGLLYLLLLRMTGALWRSAFVAALFALHPLHVESVAWIAERKDVLSTLFWLATVGAWMEFVRSRRPVWYLSAVSLYAAGLMAKPMLVTLPFTLLLLDYWPWERLSRPPKGGWGRMKGLLWEKAPLFAMAAASSVITVIAQRGAMQTLTHLPLAWRAANALHAYAGYLGKTVWPASLSVFYPHPRTDLSALQIVVSLLAILALTVLSVRLRRKAPYLLFGWLWYLGTLVPVIGIVQVGDQAMADRYTYVPLIGIFVAASWGLADLVKENRVLRRAAAGAAAAALAALFVVTRVHAGYWVDTETLFRHALAVTSGNWLAHDCLGLALSSKGRIQEAIVHYREALKYDTGYADIHNNLAMALNATGRPEEARSHLREAVRLDPKAPIPLKNLGLALLKQGRIPEALDYLFRAERLDPDSEDSHLYLGQALEQAGDPAAALEQYEKAARINPASAPALNGIGLTLGKMGRIDESIAHLQEVVRIKPDFVEAHINLGVALDRVGRTPEAMERFRQALKIEPDSVSALDNLGLDLGRMNRIPEAVELFRKAVRLAPDSAAPHSHLGIALMRTGRLEEAQEQFREALKINPDDAQAQAGLESIRARLREGR